MDSISIFTRYRAPPRSSARAARDSVLHEAVPGLVGAAGRRQRHRVRRALAEGREQHAALQLQYYADYL